MRIPFLLKNRNFYLMLFMDAVLVCLAFWLAFVFRFDADIPVRYKQVLLDALPWVVPVKLTVFYLCKLYYGMWRYTSLKDLRNVMIASVTSSLFFLSLLFLQQKLGFFPRTVLVMDLILTFLFIAGIRVSIRMIMARFEGKSRESFFDSRVSKRMAIIGAGRTGESVIREMNSNPDLKMRPVVLFDDDQVKHGKGVHGTPIVGGVEQLYKNSRFFDEIIIALPSVKGERIRKIVQLCEKTKKPFRIMPNMAELMDGKISVKATRKVRVEDLLGRDEVNLDFNLINKSYSEKTVLITGAGGSIGSELVRQIGKFKPGQIVLVDFSEYNLFKIDLQVRQVFPDIHVSSKLVDIRKMDMVLRLMTETKPEIVLHAAAYKHVPLQEMNPWEAVFNNILGTRNLIQASIESKAERFILVSTDKAVRPTNVMGATKRCAEMLTECVNGISTCKFAAVRFGNVLGSSGSVIPVFEEQIRSRMPITVTHPDVTRYFMSVSEAAQLILQAGAMAEGGEIFLLDMGKSVRIQDMARDLIRLHGLEPDKDVSIVYTGLRPGEKLYEELITEGEGIVETMHEKIRVIRGQHCNQNELDPKIEELLTVASTYDPKKVKEHLKNIVPEYVPDVNPDRKQD